MTDTTTISTWAGRLEQARLTRVPIEPITATEPDLSLAQAYAIQQAGIEARIRDGARVVGHKIGLTAEAVQRQLGVDQPDYGALLDDMELADGQVVDSHRLVAPRAEAEVAFVLASPLSGPDVTAADVRAATSHVAVAIEIVDSRIADWRIRLPDTVADNASSGLFVLGARQPYGGQPLDGIATRVLRDGELVEEGSTSAVLGDPCAAVAWLARALHALGTTLEAGAVVLSGAATRMVDVHAGERFTAEMDGLGAVSLSFEAARR